MSRLLDGPMRPWIGETAEELRSPGELDFTGFEILQDTRIIDMRDWNPVSAKDDATSLVYGYRRVKILKLSGFPGRKVFRMDALATHAKTQIRFPLQDLQPKVHMFPLETTLAGEKMIRWQVSADFSEVPAGEFVDLVYEHISPGQFLRRGASWTSISFQTQADTAEVARWFLLPRGKDYRSFRILRWETAKPETVEPVKVVTEYLADDSTILAFKLLSVKAGITHEVTWYYK